MTRRVRIIGAPTDYGGNRRGVDMGPSALRYAGLASQLTMADVEVEDTGDLLVPRIEQRDDPENETAKFIRETADVCARLEEEVAAALDDGAFPLVLGGDHSVAVGTARGAARDADIGAIWFDAHGDFNTPATSPSGNVHGMPLAALLGHGEFPGTDWGTMAHLSEENVAIVGLRSVDETEREDLLNSDVTLLTMSDVDERGIADVIEEALSVATDGTDGVHVSLDLDWLDPKEAPGVGTPVRGGVTYREAHAAMELVARRDERDSILRSLELVEVNPTLDEHNETAQLATELAASVLGKTIL